MGKGDGVQDAAVLTRSFEYFLSESQWIDAAALRMPGALTKLAQAVGRSLAPSSWGRAKASFFSRNGEAKLEGIVIALQKSRSQLGILRFATAFVAALLSCSTPAAAAGEASTPLVHALKITVGTRFSMTPAHHPTWSS
jgi:hypothetical protein